MAESLRKITEISFQKRNTDRVNVFLDGVFAFGISIKLAEALAVGQNLTMEEIQDLQLRDERHKALKLCFEQISRRPRTEKEIRVFLGKKDLSVEGIELAVNRLIELDYLNDEEFALQWIENRQSFRPRSRSALSYELKQKGVSVEIIDRVLADFDEFAAAQSAGLIALRKYRNQSPDVIRNKIAGYLSRRGFHFETIRTVIDKIMLQLGQDQSEVFP
jgi:regulatory protein